MMRSMYAGVSGLRNHQTRMDVIGNNIANVNTAGFKKSRVVFQDTLYQSIRGASRPDDNRGGTNPMAIGLGMTISSIDQIHTPAPAASTNKLTDMAVDGNGYFILKSGGQEFYTRNGAFEFDDWGRLVNAQGLNVLGYMTKIDPTTGEWKLDTNGDPTDNIDISGFKTCDAQATKRANFSGNLNADLAIPQVDDGSGGSTDIVPYPGYPGTYDPGLDVKYPGENDDAVITSEVVYDSLGTPIRVYYRFFKYEVDPGDSSVTPPIDPSTNWACDISLDPNFEKATGYTSGTHFAAVDLSTGTQVSPATGTLGPSGLDLIRIHNLKFDQNGAVVKAKDEPWLSQLKITIDRSLAPPDEKKRTATDIKVTSDFTALRQFRSESDARISYQDGYPNGALTSYSVGPDGVITGVFNNGESRPLARVALAVMANPAGLVQSGNSLYQASPNCGDISRVPAGEGGTKGIIPSSLEMSNVDLSEEFTDMIVTQRGFQANSRIITTSDEMLQELVNLKR